MSSDQKTFIVCLSFTNLYPRKPPTLQSREYLPEGRTMAGDLQRYHPSGDISHQNNSFYLDPLLTSGERSRQADLTVQSPVQHSCLCFVQNCGHLDCARPTASTITTQRGFFFSCFGLFSCWNFSSVRLKDRHFVSSIKSDNLHHSVIVLLQWVI